MALSPSEQALADASPTFADLCDRLREARRAHLRAINAEDAARCALRRAEVATKEAEQTSDVAQSNLDLLIEAECAIEDAG